MAPFRGLLESDEHYYRHAGRSLLAVVEEGDDSVDAYVAIGFVWIAFVLSFVSLFFFGYQVSPSFLPRQPDAHTYARTPSPPPCTRCGPTWTVG